MSDILTEDDQELLHKYQKHQDDVLIMAQRWDEGAQSVFTLKEIIRLSKLIKEDEKWKS